MKKLKIMFSHKIFRIYTWAFLVIVGAFIILIIIRFFNYFEVEKINNQVAKIHSTKISISDVNGDNLPTEPGVLADKTIIGIDSNNNGIRDDVEIAIFKEYPNSEKTRAVLLQYALDLQMMVNQPFMDTTIATEVAREQSRGFICVGKALTRDDNNQDIMNKYFEDSDKLRSFVENKQLNNIDRMKNNKDFYKEVRSYSDLEGDCDIDLSKLSN